jgi:hypothetical protein
MGACSLDVATSLECCRHHQDGEIGLDDAKIIVRADAIVVAGSNAPWHPPNAALRPGSAVIHLEEDPLRPRAPYWGYRTTHAVAGDREANLRGLAERANVRAWAPGFGRDSA